MSIILFPNAPTGPRPNGAFVLNLPYLTVSKAPRLFHDVAPGDQKAILDEIAYMNAAIEEVNRSVDRLTEMLEPYRVEVTA